MKRSIAAVAVALALLSGCHKQKAAPGPAGEDGPFAPAPDSALTALQVERWARANNQLDSLTFAYRDSFLVQDPTARAAAQKSFQAAQDALCRQLGMRGGYDEYRYVSASLALPVNKALRDSIGVKVFQ